MIITDRGILLQDGEAPAGIGSITKTQKVSHACADRALKLANNIAYDCTSDAAIRVRFGCKLRGQECYPLIGKYEANGLLYQIDAVYKEEIDSNWDGLADTLVDRPDTDLAKLTAVLLERAIQVSKSSIFSAEVASNDKQHISSIEIHTTNEPWLYNVGWKYDGSFSINDTESLSNMLWEYGHAIVGFDRTSAIPRVFNSNSGKAYTAMTTLAIAHNKELTDIEYRAMRMKIKKFASNHLHRD